MYVGLGICLAVALVFGAGCADKASQRATLSEQEIRRLALAREPDQPDRLIVYGEAITWEDIVATLPDEVAAVAAPPLKDILKQSAQEVSLRQFLEIYRPVMHQRLNDRIEKVVLSRRVKDELGQKNDTKLDEKLNEYAKQELRRFILEEHGGNSAEAEEALQKMGMNRTSYLQWKKKQILVSQLSDLRSVRERPVTYGEIVTRYEEMKDSKFAREGVLQLRLIDIQVDKVRLKYPNEDAAGKARQLADDLRKRIDAGEDFAELAKKHSDGLRSEEGGLWRPRDPSSLAAPYDQLAIKAQGLEAGQVDGPIEMPGRFFIMKVEEKKGRTYRPLSEVQDIVRGTIENERRRQLNDELDEEVRQQIRLVDTTRFVDYCLERFYRQTRE